MNTPQQGRRLTSVSFRPANIRGCVRVDLTRPAGDRWEHGEVARRLYAGFAGAAAGTTLQIVVGRDTPTYAPGVPENVAVQVVAADAATLAQWMAAVGGAQ